MMVCRIQDQEGRGPYRPGFSHVWSERNAGPDPIYIAFPEVIALARRTINECGGQVGCAFRTVAQAGAWFSPNEVLTLTRYGYTLCWIAADKILAENEDQLVFWSATPLAQAVIHKGWVAPDLDRARDEWIRDNRPDLAKRGVIQ